ncbi:MAG: hypothetical protein WC508_03810 [Patescibacteria group bacterium]
MQRIQSIHEVLSFFGVTSQNQVLNNRLSQYQLVVSLVSAFFIVLFATWLLSVTSSFLAGNQGLTLDQQEKSAFQPSQAVSKQINQINGGYLGIYH